MGRQDAWQFWGANEKREKEKKNMENLLKEKNIKQEEIFYLSESI